MSLDHIIILMLENNSFDRMVGSLLPPRADAQSPGGGIKGAANQFSNTDQTTGLTYVLTPTQTREVTNDPGHDLQNVLGQMLGSNKGFVTDFAKLYSKSTTAERQEIISFYDDGFLSVLHKLSKSFTVCDRWFSSMPGPTWPNRLFLYSGTSLGFTDMKALHYWDQRTLFDLLSSHGVPWKIYFGDVSSTYILVNKPDSFRVDPLLYFYKDVQGAEQNFPSFCLIEPSYFGKTPDDQHPPHDVIRGEALLATVYNALRANDALWQRSLLVVTYDEHGGFYDHIDPPTTIAPDNRRDGSGFNFDRLGVRVPAVLISPWLDQGVIPDTLDHTSLVKLLVDKWSLDDELGQNVLGARVGSPETKTFKKYVKKTPRDTSKVLPSIPVPHFLPPREQVDLTEHQNALFEMTHSLASQIGDPHIRIPLLRRPIEADKKAQLAVDQFHAFLLDQAIHKATSAKARAKPARSAARARKQTNRRAKRKR